LSPEEYDGVMLIRRMLSASGTDDATEHLIGMMSKTENNKIFFSRLKDWYKIMQKDGFTMVKK
ncbi:MAG TPA: hypothetical protein PLZ84_05675, partial [Clostridia bacterium]|nr:hypothetical protein [Clostridia bacterium]